MPVYFVTQYESRTIKYVPVEHDQTTKFREFSPSTILQTIKGSIHTVKEMGPARVDK